MTHWHLVMKAGILMKSTAMDVLRPKKVISFVLTQLTITVTTHLFLMVMDATTLILMVLSAM